MNIKSPERPDSQIANTIATREDASDRKFAVGKLDKVIDADQTNDWTAASTEADLVNIFPPVVK